MPQWHAKSLVPGSIRIGHGGKTVFFLISLILTYIFLYATDPHCMEVKYPHLIIIFLKSYMIWTASTQEPPKVSRKNYVTWVIYYSAIV